MDVVKKSWEGSMPSRFLGGNNWADSEWVLEVEHDVESEDKRMRFVEVCLNVGERRGQHAAISWFTDLDKFDREKAAECRQMIEELEKFEWAIAKAREAVVNALDGYELDDKVHAENEGENN